MNSARGIVTTVVVLGLLAASGTAVLGLPAAKVSSRRTYSVIQGDRCIPIHPLGDGSQTVSSFYDYRISYQNRAAYSSIGTTNLQRSQVSQFFLYRGSQGTSLVFLHDAFRDGTGGGTVTVDIAGLPTGNEWPVEDDSYHNRDDVFRHGATTTHIEHVWIKGRTDGSAVRGLGKDFDAITVRMRFNENSVRWGDTSDNFDHTFTSADKITRWIVRDGDGGTERLDMGQSVTIEHGGCGTPTPTPTP
ncbi:MAG: cell surface glycoprotein related protein, partial [Salinigranum sp.]